MELSLPKNERIVRDLRSVGIADVPLIGAYAGTQAAEQLSPHLHSGCIEIHLIKKGSQVFYVDERFFNVRGGECFITQPDEMHGTGGSPVGRSTIYWIQISVAGLTGSLLSLAGDDSVAVRSLVRELPSRHFNLEPHHFSEFEEIFNLAEKPETGLERTELRMRITLWFMSLLKQSSEGGLRSLTPDVEKVLELIDDDPSAAVSVEDMAVHAGVSVVTLQRRFKSQTGMTPHDYLISKRVECAVELLASSDMSAVEIAADLGFSSSQHFSTVFRRYTGLTPSAYRLS